MHTPMSELFGVVCIIVPFPIQSHFVRVYSLSEWSGGLICGIFEPLGLVKPCFHEAIPKVP